MLFLLNSCGDDASLEELNPSDNEKVFVTLEGPDGKIVTKEVPSELQKEPVTALPRKAPCKARITNNYQNDWNGVSINGANIIVPAGSTISRGCSCSGYIWLVTSGPGRSISWSVKTNISSGVSSVIGLGTLPSPSGETYTYYPD